MSWKIALVVALLNAVITALVAMPVADRVTRAMDVSDFEGGRGMAIVFIFIPVAFIGGGFLLGLLGAKLVHAMEWAHFWKASGIALLLGQGSLFGIAGLALLSVVHPPVLDGHYLALRIEVYMPARLLPNGKLDRDKVKMSLYAGDKDNRYAEIDTAHIVHEGDTVMIPAEATLNSASAFRMLSITVEGTDGYALDPLPLPPKPTAKDLEWTARMPMREAKLTGTSYTFTDVLLRYRVVKKEKVAED
ncbi:MAG: hypothetical protein IPK99_03845 [Flavobacteriales bacterium]|nr:hypothetical protein [Flavobacteriales bacterium]